MGKPEQRRTVDWYDDEPEHPSPLPPELAEFLGTKDLVCLIHDTDIGSVFVIKAPGREIASVAGRIAIVVTHGLHRQPSAPVIRTVLMLYDQPARPLKFETFTNVADPQQQADFAALATQKDLYLLFYDEQLRHRLSKSVANTRTDALVGILAAATSWQADIPRELYDFDRAKTEVIRGTPL